MSGRAYQRVGEAVSAARDYADACGMDEIVPGARERWISSILIHSHGRDVVKELSRVAPNCVERILSYAHSKRRYDTVYRLASLAIRAAPNDPRILYWRGRMAFHRGHWAEASIDTAMLLGMHNDRAEGYLLEGLLLRRKDPESALHLFEEAVQKDLRWGEPTLLWAETAIDLKDRDGLRRALSAIRMHAGFSGRSHQVAKSLQGRFALRMGEYEQAVQAFQAISGYVRARPLLRKCYLESLIGWRRFAAARVLCKDAWPPSIAADVRSLCETVPPGAP
jgi:tetratricopeptide (TPR) repeat protein